jgi:hypothetical protein
VNYGVKSSNLARSFCRWDLQYNGCSFCDRPFLFVINKQVRIKWGSRWKGRHGSVIMCYRPHCLDFSIKGDVQNCSLEQRNNSGYLYRSLISASGCLISLCVLRPEAHSLAKLWCWTLDTKPLPAEDTPFIGLMEARQHNDARRDVRKPYDKWDACTVTDQPLLTSPVRWLQASEGQRPVKPPSLCFLTGWSSGDNMYEQTSSVL